MKKRKLMFFLLGGYLLSFLSIDNALSLYVINSNATKQFNIDAVGEASANTKRFYFCTTTTWEQSFALEYVYLFNSSTKESNATFPGINITETRIASGISSWQCRYYIDVDLNSFDSCVFSRVNPSSTSTVWNQTVDITLNDSFNTITIDNDSKTNDKNNVSTSTLTNVESNLKDIYFVANSTWYTSDARPNIHLFGKTITTNWDSTNLGVSLYPYASDSSTKTWKISVDMNVYSQGKFVRMNPDGNGSKSGLWNEASSDSNISSYNTFTFSSWSSDSKFNITPSTKTY